jgi:hypothetical protein
MEEEDKTNRRRHYAVFSIEAPSPAEKATKGKEEETSITV